MSTHKKTKRPQEDLKEEEEYQIMTRRKFKKIEERNLHVKISIGNKEYIFQPLENRLSEAEKLFKQLEGTKKEEEKFKTIKEIIKICEINSKYNSYYLKLCNAFNKDLFEKEAINLSNALTKDEYKVIFQKAPNNPAKEIYDLIISFIYNIGDYYNKIKNINFVEYNFPLSKGLRD